MNPAEIERLLVWLRRHARGDAGFVELSHINVGGHATTIDRWPVAETDGEAELVRLATDIHRSACDDADGQQLAHGPQQYLVNHFAGGDTRTAASRLPFAVLPARQANFGPPGEGIATEPPTQAGFIGMVMRHCDAAQQRAWATVGHSLAMVERYTGQIANENARLRDQNFELTRNYEELLTQHHVRELAAQTALHDRAEKTLLYGRLSELAPPIASFLVSKMAQAPATALGSGRAPELPPSPTLHAASSVSGSIDPAEETAARPAVVLTLAARARALFEGLGPEQLLALQRALTTEQTIAFGALSTTIAAGADDLLAVQLRALLDSLSKEQLVAVRSALTVEQTESLIVLWQSLPPTEAQA